MAKRLVIISCGKEKIWDRQPDYGYCPAREAYLGPFFTCNRRYAEALAPEDWMILSARFGLLRPDTPISNYNATFANTSGDEIGVDQIRIGAIQLGVAKYDEIEVLAGRGYVDKLVAALQGVVTTIVLPFATCSGNGEMMGRAKSATEAGMPMDMLDDGFESHTLSVDKATDFPVDKPVLQERRHPVAQHRQSGKTSNPDFIRRMFELHDLEGKKQRDAVFQAAKEFGIELAKSYRQHPGVLFHYWRKRTGNVNPSEREPRPAESASINAMPATERVTTPAAAIVDSAELVERLIELGKSIGSDDLVFENDPLVGNLIKDDPFAFLLAASLDRGMKAELVWRIPAKIKEVLGHLDPVRIAEMTNDEMLRVLQRIKGKPRYLSDAARTVVEVAGRVVNDYDGNARNLWKDQSAAVIKSRMRQIFGVAKGIASMVVILLDRLGQATLGPEDYEEMDPKADVHVQRVFARLGFCGGTPSERDVIKAARRLHPSYPGELDSPSWHIGRTWCHATDPDCGGCPMTEICPKIL